MISVQLGPAVTILSGMEWTMVRLPLLRKLVARYLDSVLSGVGTGVSSGSLLHAHRVNIIINARKKETILFIISSSVGLKEYTMSGNLFQQHFC